MVVRYHVAPPVAREGLDVISILQFAGRRCACATVALTPEPDPFADVGNGATAAFAASVWDSIVAVTVRLQDGALLAA